MNIQFFPMRNLAIISPCRDKENYLHSCYDRIVNRIGGDILGSLVFNLGAAVAVNFTPL